MKKLILLSMFCASAHAQNGSIMYSGQDLYTRITSNPALANGYIAGVHDSQSGVTICIPSNTVTLGQMSDMVKALLEKVPSERHLPADIFVQAALENRWPCKKKGGGV
jgi:hypothetical protein